MIKGIHAMFHSADPAATRAFLRDILGLPFTDVGEGWLIFDTAEGEIGSHPLMEDGAKPFHEISLYTDDVEATVTELQAKGVEFKGPLEDRGWGLATEIVVPGGLVVTLYQPRYKKG
jgi:catechol 2,3-dioxygenase-like lactoylglutathione lyase family enzyme